MSPARFQDSIPPGDGEPSPEVSPGRQSALLATLRRLRSATLEGRPTVRLAELALEELSRLVPHDLGCCALLLPEEGQLQFLAFRGDGPFPFPLDARLPLEPESPGQTPEADLPGGPGPGKDRLAHDPLRQLNGAGYSARLDSCRGRAGFRRIRLALFARAADAFSSPDAGILADVADQLAIAQVVGELHERMERHTAELDARVRQDAAELADLYHNAPCGYHSLGPEGQILRINDTELRWLGYRREEVVGRMHIFDLLAPESQPLVQHKFKEFRQSGHMHGLELTLQRRDGRRLPVLLDATALYDRSGNFVMSRSSVYDNTARKKAEEELRASRDALNQANLELARAVRLKDEFLANMSHELRTPLNAVLGTAEILQMPEVLGPLAERQREALQTIEDSGRHLLSLINDILDLAKIESGSETLDIAPVEVPYICHSCLAFVKEAALRKHVVVETRLDPEVERIAADERRLKQILVNLLNNAVKFTPPGGRVSLEVDGDREGRFVRFRVADTGIGIEAKDLPRLFQPFVQLDSGLTRQYEGTGLGLALVARMVELHSGRVAVESEPGAGSRFSVFLPWAEARQDGMDTPAAPPAQAAGPPDTGLPAPLVLVAEDNEANVRLLASYLRAKGYRVSVARNGRDALAAARSEPPAVILMDLQMPVMDGLEAMGRLRAEPDPRLSGIPVIVLTARAMPGDRAGAIEAGADDYLAKPVDLNRLLQMIEKLRLSRREAPENRG